MNFIMFAMGSPPGGGGEGGITQLIPLLIPLIAIWYFLVIRPEQRKKKEHQETLKSLKKSDRVVTSSGIIGVVAGVKQNSIMLKVADNVKIEILRSHVSQVLDKNDPKPS